VKFAIDAQLPRRLAQELAAAGHDAIHSLDLPLANRTPDNDLIALADRESRVVVTKDSDFVTSFLLRGVPSRLLLISTGNIANDALLDLFRRNLPGLESILSKHSFVELSRFSLTVHL
jgi:predicted nuclease of predicted toxin-antitoxin system